MSPEGGGCTCSMEGMHMSQGMHTSQGGDAHVLRVGHTCSGGMQMSQRGAASVPGGGGMHMSWRDADVPGRGMQGLERRCTRPSGQRGRRQGAGSRRARAVPHSPCAVCYPPLVASQPGSEGLPLSPTQLPSGVCALHPTALHPTTPLTPRRGARAAPFLRSRG